MQTVSIDRRNFLKMMGLGGAALGNAALVSRMLAYSPPGTFTPMSAWERNGISHVISRLTFGATDNLIKHVEAVGPEAFIEEQLAYETLDDGPVEALVSDLDILKMTAGEAFATYEQQRGQIIYQLQANVILRALYSNRQLFEHMVHFWTDHFNVFIQDGPVVYFKIDDDRDVIRRFAMDNFRTLLGASAHSPAMLYYLNNAESRREAPNENYARELMELHTLGVEGGYTEQDVKEVARCFTGWTITRPRLNQGKIAYVFVPEMHDDGEKIVLGNVIPAGGGVQDGETVLDILAAHPSTARFISTKLARRFIADDPPETLIKRCAETYLNSEGNIRSVLRVIFASEEFWNAPPKFKRPVEYVSGVLRAMSYEVQNPRLFSRTLSPVLQNLGQSPFFRPSPDGYPDVQEAWSDGLLMRWNFAIDATEGNLAGASGSLLPILEAHGVPLEVEPVMKFMAEFLYGRTLLPEEESVFRQFLIESGADTAALQSAIALLMAAPTFQYR